MKTGLAKYILQTEKNIYKVSFDVNNGLNTALRVKNSKLFSTRSYDPTFVRTITLIPGKIKVSAGKNFSYSSNLKHPNSES